MKRLVLIIIVCWLLLSAGCTGQEQPTPTVTSGPTAAPTAAPDMTAATGTVAADGIIGQDEYKHSLSPPGSGFTVHWKNDDEILYMALTGEVTGWVAIGFEPTTGMKDADMILGLVSNGAVSVEDMYSTGNFGPHPPDTELGGAYDILSAGGSESDGTTVIEFSRRMETGDEYDSAFTPGQTVRFIWGLANSDTPSFRHNAGRGTSELTLD
jgi:hypothetical protein